MDAKAHSDRRSLLDRVVNPRPRSVRPPVSAPNLRTVSPAFVALTGTVAAGKSSALAALDGLGAATVSSDAIVHELLATDELRHRLVERWGEGVAPDGEVDRSRVAQIVFRDPDELVWLESQLHPRVGERIVAWRDALDPNVRVAVVEVPLLFESGMETLFDAVLSVIAPHAVREERAAGRGLGELAGRGGRQLSDEAKAARSDFVVTNDGSLSDLEAKLAEVLPELEARGS
jgi:dephospho-CoA kinase